MAYGAVIQAGLNVLQLGTRKAVGQFLQSQFAGLSEQWLHELDVRARDEVLRLKQTAIYLVGFCFALIVLGTYAGYLQKVPVVGDYWFTIKTWVINAAIVVAFIGTLTIAWREFAVGVGINLANRLSWGSPRPGSSHLEIGHQLIEATRLSAIGYLRDGVAAMLTTMMVIASMALFTPGHNAPSLTFFAMLAGTGIALWAAWQKGATVWPTICIATLIYDVAIAILLVSFPSLIVDVQENNWMPAITGASIICIVVLIKKLRNRSANPQVAASVASSPAAAKKDGIAPVLSGGLMLLFLAIASFGLINWLTEPTSSWFGLVILFGILGFLFGNLGGQKTKKLMVAWVGVIVLVCVIQYGISEKYSRNGKTDTIHIGCLTIDPKRCYH